MQVDVPDLPPEFVKRALDYRARFGAEALREYVRTHLTIKQAPSRDSGSIYVEVDVVWPPDEATG